ncbi:MAG: hypothetical protein EON54_02560 [Alcaligenaceae bacterium]|nr:MAG: hypothetical protein EON54_02560 [Alcaligenaceae bacterium]
MPGQVRPIHSALAIRDEVIRVAARQDGFKLDSPLFTVGLPVLLRGRDEMGANWTLFLPGTSFRTPAIRLAIDQVRARWDLG